jgi:hypothetical protein
MKKRGVAVVFALAAAVSLAAPLSFFSEMCQNDEHGCWH